MSEITDLNPKTKLSLEPVRALVAQDFAALNAYILANLHSGVELVKDVAHYIVESGGKRLRSLLVLLSAKALGYEGQRHIDLAAIIEFIHTATLLHDDVVDESNLRRGRQTANAVWGNQTSVLVGDFLYSRAFQLMAKLENLAVMQVLADTTNTIAEGEVLQLMNRHDPEVTEACYLEVIRCKTAVLFAAACQLGAIIAKQSDDIQKALFDYGLHLGLAFQLIDDLLDYVASAEMMGKNMGDDLAEGKPTLPLIYALKHSATHDAEIIRHAIANGGTHNIQQIQQILIKSNAFNYIKDLAQKEITLAKVALSLLPASSYRSALSDLADFAVNRTY